MIHWMVLLSCVALATLFTAHLSPFLLLPVASPTQALSPYYILVLVLGGGMILFSLAGGVILLYFSRRVSQPSSPNQQNKNQQNPSPAIRPANPAPKKKPLPETLEMELELTWQDILSLKTEWKGSQSRPPKKQVLFPPVNLRLRFRVEMPRQASTSPATRLDGKTVHLTTDSNIEDIAAGQNLFHRARHLKIIEHNDHLLKGELLLKNTLTAGEHTFSLEARLPSGNIQRIDLHFTCILPEMTLLLEQDEKSTWIKLEQGITRHSQPDLASFLPQSLRFSFRVRGLPEPVGRDAWLDSQHAPQLTATFPLQPHPRITIRPGTNLLKGGEVLRSIVYTRWQGNQIQGTFYAAGPLSDGLHSLKMQVRDDQDNRCETSLDFLIAGGDLQAVNQAGDRMSMITPVKWEEREVNEESIRRFQFHLQAADPAFAAEAGGTRLVRTAQLESLDQQGKPLVPLFKIPMQDEAGTYCLRSTVPLLAYPHDKPAPISGNILPVPVTPGGKLRAFLEGTEIRLLDLPVAQLKIDQVWGSLEDGGASEEKSLNVFLWFTLPIIDLPSEVYLFLSPENGEGRRWQAGARPVLLRNTDAGSGQGDHQSALAQFTFSGENCPLGAFSIFSDIPLNQAFLRVELAFSLDPEYALPAAISRLPLCSLGSLWMEVGDREFNPDEMRKDFALNPLADSETLPVSLSVRPVGSAVSALGCIRLERDGIPLTRHVVEFPALKTVTGPDEVERFGRLDMEWKPELAPLCAGKGAMVFCFNVRAHDAQANSTFWYRLKRTVPSIPAVEDVERTGVEFRWKNETGGEEMRRVEGSVFLTPRHAVVLPDGAVVKVSCTLRAKNLYGNPSSVKRNVPVEWKLEDPSSGAALLDNQARPVTVLHTQTDDTGVASAAFRTPPFRPEKGETAITITIRPEPGEMASFPFRSRRRGIRRVDGPRQVIANSQHTYELHSLEGSGEDAVEWAFYPLQKDGSMPAEPERTGRGEKVTCLFNKIENQRGVPNPARSYPYWLAARLAGDEEILTIHSLEIEVTPRIDNDIMDLGASLSLKAQIFPLEPRQPDAWRWLLLKEGEDQPVELAHEETERQQESQMNTLILDEAGKFRLRVETGGGFREQAFRVEPLRIFGTHAVVPGETAHLTVRNENLVQAKWTVYSGVNRIFSAAGASLDWRAGAIGYYEVAVDWCKDENSASHKNDAVHRILVARIYTEPTISLDTPIPPGERRRFLTNPAEFRGRKPRWRITYQHGEKRWTEDLGEHADGIWLRNTGEAEKGYLEASFGSYDDMGEVVTRAVILLNPAGGLPPGEKTIGTGVLG